ncbi:hypothetical protein AVEN_255107-1 [Araneus ventricosus]|uniref:Uncharacterized protein n=1 Tax=Araneus ventricosus TaxID=182803 RepID=A0A4Y1ZNA2_ARAVE|nr:hypothetical protein AVEN_255107-1 [Araneus ventricosus]
MNVQLDSRYLHFFSRQLEDRGSRHLQHPELLYRRSPIGGGAAGHSGVWPSSSDRRQRNHAAAHEASHSQVSLPGVQRSSGKFLFKMVSMDSNSSSAIMVSREMK